MNLPAVVMQHQRDLERGTNTMRIEGKIAVLSVLGIMGTRAAELPTQEQAGSRSVTLCLSYSLEPKVEIASALGIASKMFAEIGIQLNGHSGQQYCKNTGERTIVVNLSSQTPPTRHPGALAYALPFEGQHIEIFYDRIVRLGLSRSLTARLLAYVLVHEITHLLQRLDHHSSDGIMKARWKTEEYLDKRSRVTFTEDDVDLIYRGMGRPR